MGSFFFKNLNFFQNPLKAVFKKKIKVNNEYYLDTVVAESLNLGLNVGEIIVKNYVSWGSHKELEIWKKENKYI